MNLVNNNRTYVHFLYRDGLTYLQKVATEKKYATPVIDFYNTVVAIVEQAPETGRKRLFLEDFSNRIRNTKTCAKSQAKRLLNTIERCMDVEPGSLMPKVNPQDVTVNLLTDPEKETITAEELKRKADFYGYEDLFGESIH